MTEGFETVAAASLVAVDGAPARVKLLPIGTVEMRDGRGPYHVRDLAHARAIVAATQAHLGSIDLMFDYDHQLLYAPRDGVGGTAVAAGWGKPSSLAVESDGIYIDVEWTAAAAAKIGAREYRYLSPTFMADAKSGDVLRFKNVALVNAPAIEMPAIAAATEPEIETEEVAAMLITPSMIRALSTGWSALYNRGFKAVDPLYTRIAMKTVSQGEGEVYGWLGSHPAIREWVGDRHIKSIAAYGFKLLNRKFESTISVPRTSIEDDLTGVLNPVFENFGKRVAEFPDTLLAELIAGGFTSPCYDNQNFFDAEHPISIYSGGDAPEDATASNYQAGAGPAWYLLDLTQPFRPFIYQERIPFKFTSLNHDVDENVFMADEYIYGTRGRCNVGYGLWQLAYASKAELTAENYETVRTAMAKRVDDNGKLLGVRPSTLLVPVELEGKARKLLKNSLGEGGESNSWVDSAELIVSPWL